MTIQIYPVKRLYQLLAERDTGKCGAIISSASEIDTSRLHGISYVFRKYEDLDYECPQRAFSRADAESFAEYIKGLENDMDILYCCCDAGQSRSPAVAAAVMRYFGVDDMPIWRDPHYHPNMLVFSMLTDTLNCGVSDGEKDLRIYTNRKAFLDAIRKG